MGIYACCEVLNTKISGDQRIIPHLTSFIVTKASDLNVDEDEDEVAVNEDFEHDLIDKYNEFLQELSADDSIQLTAENENVAFISILEKLPFISDPINSDVRYETLIKKLVFHIRENIKVVPCPPCLV